MKLPHRTNHDDDDDGDEAKKQHTFVGQLCLCQCLNVSKSGETAWIRETTKQGTQTPLVFGRLVNFRKRKIQFQAYSTQKDPGSEAC